MESLIIPSFSLWFLIKIMVILILFMYLIFALVIVRQVKLMTDTLRLGYEGLVKALSLAHFIFAIIVLFAAFVIL